MTALTNRRCFRDFKDGDHIAVPPITEAPQPESSIDTPVRALGRQHAILRKSMDDAPIEPTEVLDALFEAVWTLEKQIMATPAKDAQDVVIKFAIASNYGENLIEELEWFDWDQLWAEAAAAARF